MVRGLGAETGREIVVIGGAVLAERPLEGHRHRLGAAVVDRPELVGAGLGGVIEDDVLDVRADAAADLADGMRVKIAAK